MRVLVFFLSALALVFATKASASGSRVGNGGGGVKCPGRQVELLDIYEAREAYGYVETWSPSGTLDEALARYQTSLAMALGYEHPFMDVLFKELALLRITLDVVDQKLPLSFDLGVTTIRSDCELEQVALRGEDILAGELRITKNFWNSATPSHKALLLIHEAAHAWFNLKEPTIGSETVAARQLVGLLYSGVDYDVEKAELVRHLVKTRLPRSLAEMRGQ